MNSNSVNNNSNTNANSNINTNNDTNNNTNDINNNSVHVNTIISALKSISLDDTRDKLFDIFEKKLVDTINSFVEEAKTVNNNNTDNNNINNNNSIFSAINSILSNSLACESKHSNPSETKSCNIQCKDAVCSLPSLLPKRSDALYIRQNEKTLQKEFDSISKSELIKENEKLHKKIEKIQKQFHVLSEKMNKYTKKISENCRMINEIVGDTDFDISSESDSD